MMGKKRCFVVMGYGKKTDFATGRTLDLDKVYQHVIKPVAEELGLECVRGDEVPRSTLIDVDMYERLLEADVVIADLSTANPNAMYELGVRYALRPRATVVIAESELKYPFDLNHITITSYVHQGDVFDIVEAKALMVKLKATLQAALASDQNDSPVYTFLPDLNQPHRVKKPQAVGKIESVVVSVASLRQAAQSLIDADEFVPAEAALRHLLGLLSPSDPSRVDVLQRLALATYKGKQPTPREALERAIRVLAPLTPHKSNDPETLGLTGAINKRLWEVTGERDCLDQSIRAYERGYYIRQDYYNAINFAFMLDTRGSIQTDAGERIADRVVARRIRRDVLLLVQNAMEELNKSEPLVDEAEEARKQERLYWVLSTKAEALVGLCDEEGAAGVLAKAKPLARATWMTETTETQLAKLRVLLGADKQP